MTVTDEEKINIKRDIKCNASKIDELTREFKMREPAKETQAIFNKYNVDFALMGEEMKSLTKVITESNEENIEQHKQILSRIGRIEVFILGVLVIFALSALYFIFSKVGLPSP